MKARIKVRYVNNEKGSVFNILETHDRFITLDIDGHKTDFGNSEVEIIASTPSDLFKLGRELIWNFAVADQILMRQTEINQLVDRITWPVKKVVATKAVNHFIWDV
ncbi:MAG: hypothetical protein GY718_10070 [Lentisphaerae bacterium]|nr:hypothetical protein [Lentisphaerota bacterium]